MKRPLHELSVEHSARKDPNARLPVDIILISLFDTSPHGLFSIAGYLGQHGHSCEIVLFGQYPMLADRSRFTRDTVLRKGLLDLRNHIISRQPSIVGLTVRSPLYSVAVEVTNDIRNYHECIVVFGGPHATLMPDECLRHADVVCRGEGEVAMLQTGVPAGRRGVGSIDGRRVV